WHDLSYRPDMAGMVEDIAKDPGKALEGAKSTLEGLKQGGTGGLQQLLEGGAPRPETEPSAPAEGSETGGAPDPTETIKKLFGN
ncbi:MAG TPA: hypothetical protein VLL72_11885, partial [Kiloniellales bacterium]|nr:hypothetical protein [Kiloniellales bacterium]